jgi:hypothetical protein
MFLALIDAPSWFNSSYRFSVLLLVVALLIIFHLYKTWAKLRHIPGPFLARLTNLPRFCWVWSRKAHEIHIDLHEKHGKLVRFGPNMVSVGDPSEIPNIYRMHAPLLKVCLASGTPNKIAVQTYCFNARLSCLRDLQPLVYLPFAHSLSTVRLLPRYPAHVQGRDHAWPLRHSGRVPSPYAEEAYCEHLFDDKSRLFRTLRRFYHPRPLRAA